MQIQPTEKDIQSLAIYLKLLSYPESYDMENDLISLKHWLDLTSNNFATRLKQNYPYLTRRETNLCCLLRMGYSWENISALMRVKKESIYRLVYRLCKKMGLEGHRDEFRTFINQQPHKNTLNENFNINKLASDCIDKLNSTSFFLNKGSITKNES